MEMMYLLIILLDAFQVVNGLAFPGAEPTSPAERGEVMLHGRSPKPTPAPALRGMMRKNDLFGRQEDINTHSTCAFIDGNSNNAVSCISDYGCAFWTTTAGESSINQYWDCCPMVGTSIVFSALDCYSATTCYDYADATQTSPHASLLTSSYGPSSYAIYCGSLEPYCVATLLGLSAYGQFTHFGCATDARERTVAAYQLPSDVPTTTSYVDSTTTDTSTTSSMPSSSSSTPPPSSTSPAPPPASSSPPPKPNTGAIAGGAVGGVAGLLAICGIIGYLVYRKRKQHKEDVPEVSQYSVVTK